MSSALTLWLVRHGETPRSRDGRLAGWVDTPLTARGEAEARRLRPFLAGERFDGVWSSDLRRAVRTARLAWGEPHRDRRLREIGFGDLEGHRWEALEPGLASALRRFDGFAAPGGESLAGLGRRVSAFVAQLPPGRHLVFTHGGVIRFLTRSVGYDGFLPTGSVAVLDWNAHRLVFIREGGQDDSA